ncbi:MAG: hypothetical protein LKM45_06300 [Wolbachia endosymbiont of Alcedoecus sp.]|nr:hypothetical protein [Wolbachia endosymbiont of Alcedoecus sp.]MDG7053452.1 hypothetical protein [Wolbachia endosymbiont of Alcedoecus sp.]
MLNTEKGKAIAEEKSMLTRINLRKKALKQVENPERNREDIIEKLYSVWYNIHNIKVYKSLLITLRLRLIKYLVL